MSMVSGNPSSSSEVRVIAVHGGLRLRSSYHVDCCPVPCGGGDVSLLVAADGLELSMCNRRVLLALVPFTSVTHIIEVAEDDSVVVYLRAPEVSSPCVHKIMCHSASQRERVHHTLLFQWERRLAQERQRAHERRVRAAVAAVGYEEPKTNASSSIFMSDVLSPPRPPSLVSD
eukprot:PhM_4_TR1269/c0_g1_i1/m.31622